MNILLTGATGCVGSYLFEALSQLPNIHLYLLVRSPQRLPEYGHTLSPITVVSGSLQTLSRQYNLLAQMNVVIHAAAAWGGPDTYTVNLQATYRLLQALQPSQCQKVFYFSTASLLDPNHQLLPMAWRRGTDYIRSKALMAKLLSQLPIYPHLTILYPTVILGGDSQHPYTHVSASIEQWPVWLHWLRYLTAQGCFYAIHAQDIAQIVVYGLFHELPQPSLVLGNDPYTVDEALTELCYHFGLSRPLQPWSLEPLLPLLQWGLKRKMNDWDRYCLQSQRYSRYQVTNAHSLGLKTDHWSLSKMLQAPQRAISPST